MFKNLSRVFFLYGAIAITFVIGTSAYLFFAYNPKNPTLVRQSINPNSKNRPFVFAALPSSALEIKVAVASEDARPLLIERYLSHYKSPMLPYTAKIIEISDRNKVDPLLVVAIAQQESNLGKITPPDCHNAWGWGIHSAGTLCFDNWEEGLDTFTRGLATKYHAYGLNNPEEIMTKYNATSPGGAWAKGVNQFLNELNSGEW